MNAAQRREFLEAAAACLGLRLRGLHRLLGKVDDLNGSLRWEAAFSPGERVSSARLRCFEATGPLHDWAGRAAVLFGAQAAARWAPPSAGLPRLSIDWDAERDRPRRLGFFGRAFAGQPSQGVLLEPEAGLRLVRFEEVPFSSKIFPQEKLNKDVGSFHALCPIASVRLEWEDGGGGAWRAAQRWALRLKRPLAWPLFLRLDLAAAFAQASGPLSLLALDREVSEVAFEQETPWAYFGAKAWRLLRSSSRTCSG